MSYGSLDSMLTAICMMTVRIINKAQMSVGNRFHGALIKSHFTSPNLTSPYIDAVIFCSSPAFVQSRLVEKFAQVINCDRLHLAALFALAPR